MSKAEAATKRTVRAMERTAKVDFATIQGGLFSPGGLSKSNQMRSAMEGLGLSMKKMSADHAASIRQAGQSLAQGDPIYSGLFGFSNAASSGRGMGGAGAKNNDPYLKMEMIGRGAMTTRSAIALASAATYAWKKDWDAVGESVKGMPFGIGAMAAEVMDLKAEWTGAKLGVEKYNEMARRGEMENAAARRRADVFKSIGKSGSIYNDSISDQLGAIGRKGLDATLYAIRAASNARIAALRREQREQFEASGVDSESAEAKRIERAYTSRISKEQELAARLQENAAAEDRVARMDSARATMANVGALRLQLQDKNFDAEIMRIREEGQIRADVERRLGNWNAGANIQEEADTKILLLKRDRERDQSNALLGIRAETGAMMLRMQRKDFDAEKVLIDEVFRTQIDAAKRSGQAELAERLSVKQQLATAGALYQYNQGIVSSQKLSMLSGFANPTVAVSGKQQREDALGQTQLKTLERVKDLLDKIEQNTRDQGVRVGNN